MGEIIRTPVVSSNLLSAGFDGENIFQVEFKGGGVYNISPFTKDEYEDFIQAESKGKWYWANIRNSSKNIEKLSSSVKKSKGKKVKKANKQWKIFI